MENTTQTTPATKECDYCGQQSKTDPCEFCDRGIQCKRCRCTMNEKTEGYHKETLCRECESELLDVVEDLTHAMSLALEEIEQWKEVMGGSEDSRTEDAIDALRDALTKAHGKTT